jgi:hypothetical protein
MATVSDVEAALQDLIFAALYPNGAPPSVLGYPVKIYAGWPDPQQLDADMVETAPGVPTAAHVAIYPLPAERNTTRYPKERDEDPIPATTYTLTAAGQVITVGGAAPNPYVPQNLAAFVNGKPYVVQATAGQTPAQVAAALRAAIAADVAGTSIAGAQITLPAGAAHRGAAGGLDGLDHARGAAPGEAVPDRTFCASSPASPRCGVGPLRPGPCTMWLHLALADGSLAYMTYHGSREDDFAQKQRIYRRLHVFTVEYATTITEAAAQIVAGEVDIAAADGTPLATNFS